MIDRNSSIPLHYQVKEFLKQEINQKKFASSKLFPSERQLVVKFGISRGTARHALSSLVQEGFIIRRPGQGSFVSSKTETIKPRPSLETIGLVMYAPALEIQGFSSAIWGEISYITQRDKLHIVLLPFTEEVSCPMNF